MPISIIYTARTREVRQLEESRLSRRFRLESDPASERKAGRVVRAKESDESRVGGDALLERWLRGRWRLRPPLVQTIRDSILIDLCACPLRANLQGWLPLIGDLACSAVYEGPAHP